MRSLLIPLLSRNENREFLTRAQQGAGEWRELMAERGTSTDVLMHP